MKARNVIEISESSISERLNKFNQPTAFDRIVFIICPLLVAIAGVLIGQAFIGNLSSTFYANLHLYERYLYSVVALAIVTSSISLIFAPAWNKNCFIISGIISTFIILTIAVFTII